MKINTGNDNTVESSKTELELKIMKATESKFNQLMEPSLFFSIRSWIKVRRSVLRQNSEKKSLGHAPIKSLTLFTLLIVTQVCLFSSCSLKSPDVERPIPLKARVRSDWTLTFDFVSDGAIRDFEILHQDFHKKTNNLFKN